MIKIAVILVFIYNIMITVSDPNAKSMILNIGLLALLLSLFINASKKAVAIIFKIISVTAIAVYLLIHFGVITI